MLETHKGQRAPCTHDLSLFVWCRSLTVPESRTWTELAAAGPPPAVLGPGEASCFRLVLDHQEMLLVAHQGHLPCASTLACKICAPRLAGMWARALGCYSSEVPPANVFHCSPVY